MSNWTYWCLGQIGIVIEILGAFVVILFSGRTWYYWRNLPPMTHYPMDKVLEGPKEEFVGQFRGQAIAFVVILAGLVLQLIGNYGQRPSP